MNVNIGDTIKLLSENAEKQFKVCGITESGYYVSDAAVEMCSYLDDKSLNSKDEYNVFVNIKSEKNKQNIVDKVLTDSGVEVSGDTKSGNSELLYLTGNGGDSAFTKSLNTMAIFVIVIIVICTITVIYNSFNISVIERIRYFGILKAIGASPKQIKRIIFREGLVIGIIAFPLGCILGFLGLKIGIELFLGNNLMFMDSFKVKFYPKILLITAAVVAVTIYLSIMQPARKAKKVSAVEAMRNIKEISVIKIKRRKGRLVGKIFGIEGSLAYKNIRRTPTRFIITVIALTISLIMFNVFYGLLDFTKQVVTDLYGTIPFDSELGKINNSEFTDEEIENIESKKYTDTIYKLRDEYFQVVIGKEKFNDSYGNSIGELGAKIGEKKIIYHLIMKFIH
ncbi:MAG: FtsX-like permease family protein [Clostridia bacterium]|nr:FtsX-like permease family protein [Clostridia bacterium]